MDTISERARAELHAGHDVIALAAALASSREELRLQDEELQSTHELLERERRRYRELFEWAPEGYVITDRHGAIVETNASAAKLLNTTRRALSRKPLVVFVPEEDRRGFRSELRRVREHRGACELFIRLQPRGREPIVAIASVAPMTHDAGELMLCWLLRDASVRERQRLEVEELNRQLEARVAERTRDLRGAIRELEREVDRRRESEEQRRQLGLAEREARLAAERGAARTQRLLEIVVALADAATIGDLARAVATKAREAAGAEIGVLFMGAEQGDHLEALAIAGPRAMADTLERWARDAASGEVLAFLSAGRHDIPRSSPRRIFPGVHDVVSAALLPLAAQTGGALTLVLGWVGGHELDAEEQAFLSTVARQAGQAFERLHALDAERLAVEELRQARAALEARVGERTAELARANDALRHEIAQREAAVSQRNALLLQLAVAQEEERRRLARELHDEVGQHIAALRLGLQALSSEMVPGTTAAEEVDRLQLMANALGGELHQMAVQLRPRALDDFGLETALASQASDWTRRSGIEVDLHVDLAERLPSAVENALYRTVQEALTNVVKHAAASRVSVIVERRDGAICAIVEDDGRGLTSLVAQPERAIPGVAPRLGLLGIRERVALLDGTVDVESEAGVGTTLFVRIPVPSTEAVVP